MNVILLPFRIVAHLLGIVFFFPVCLIHSIIEWEWDRRDDWGLPGLIVGNIEGIAAAFDDAAWDLGLRGY